MSRLIEWFLHADNNGIIFGLTAKSTLYHMPGSLDTFIDDFILLINELPTQHRILTDGDFNLDQMLSTNVAKVDPLIQNFNLSPHSQYSTHIHGGLLDHVLDTSNSNALSSLPSSYSDHFVLFLFFFLNLIIIFICRSSHHIEIGVLKNFTKFTEKHLCQALFLSKVAGLGLQLYLKRGSDTDVFLWICEIFKNTFFTEHQLTTASISSI